MDKSANNSSQVFQGYVRAKIGQRIRIPVSEEDPEE